ncbi:Peptide hydrolase [Mycena venus]|uniref:Peptide hydrolase n=1 Tax=Mycena venus TaxID=2733690 RepID=A0A8H6X3N1_9AGAR|nr:Peptide hydrolase [Mycena venus]
MTRSELSPHSPRVVRKAFRAQASSKGLSFKEAILSAKAKQEEEGKKVEKPVGIVRRNPGRMDGVQWNGDSFVCARQVDGDEPRAIDPVVEDGEDDNEALPRSHSEPMVVSLLDIARVRPVKRRGVAKKYEMLPTIRRVIELDDGTASEQWEEWEADSEAWDVHSEQWETQSEVWEIPGGDYGAEEWEELYGERFNPNSQGRSYSAAVRSDQR